MELSSIRAVTFDVGGTLIEPWPSVGHVYGAVASELGYGSFAAAELNHRFRQAWNAKKGFDYSRGAWSELVGRTFSELIPAQEIPRLFETLYNRFREGSAWRIHDDVLSTLAAVRASGRKLGIISNWDERLQPLLHELRLTDCFDVIVISHDVGVTKPETRIFNEAATQLDLPPSAILHVGDSVNEDVAGARAAGFEGVLLDRSGGSGIKSLRELVIPTSPMPSASPGSTRIT